MRMTAYEISGGEGKGPENADNLWQGWGGGGLETQKQADAIGEQLLKATLAKWAVQCTLYSCTVYTPVHIATLLWCTGAVHQNIAVHWYTGALVHWCTGAVPGADHWLMVGNCPRLLPIPTPNHKELPSFFLYLFFHFYLYKKWLLPILTIRFQLIRVKQA